MRYTSPYIFAKVKKLPFKYVNFVLPFILSCLMSGIISFVNLAHHLGWVDGLFHLWLSSWLFSWCIAFPTVLILLPIVRRITACFVDVSIH